MKARIDRRRHDHLVLTQLDPVRRRGYSVLVPIVERHEVRRRVQTAAVWLALVVLWAIVVYAILQAIP